MAALKACGRWMVSISGQKLIAVPTNSNGEPFVFDCSQAEKRPQETENKGDDGGNEEKGSDRILALAVSKSGTLCALTDDVKRLVLFRTEPTWRCISTRYCARSSVIPFAPPLPSQPSPLSPDDRYVVTADRDEKVRVSLLKTPYNIQSFCLGHREFVSALCIPAVLPHRLLSGSGDGTLKVWEYESGRRLQSWDLKELSSTSSTEAGSDTRLAVCSLASSPDGGHVAALCDSVPTVHLFRAKPGSDGLLSPAQMLSLPRCAWDLTFDSQGRLWVLQQDRENPALLYTRTEGGWERKCECTELLRLEEVLQTHWEMFQDSVGVASCFQHLYKVNFDNMASYLQKKQERIQQQNQQRGKKRAGQLPQCNSNKKKAKKGGTAQSGS
ncbi:tRNA (guanine-N(7)-)-methyltransferase non-catalytic subunit wdr4-like [Arapaima gigas]